MTRLEFIEAIKVALPDIKEEDIKDIVSFLNFHIYYDSINVKIRGKIPYELAKEIEKKYSCEKLRINAGAIGNSTCPDPFFKDDKYNYELNKPMPNESINSRSIRLNAERFKLSKRSNSQKYLEVYRIGSKEGLITILKEFVNYYSASKDSFLDKSIDGAIKNANIQIISSINPCITGAKWIGQTISYASYYMGWCNTSNSLENKELRRALDEFDRSVNPFMEGDLSIEEIVNDLKNLKVFIEPLYTGSQEGQQAYYKITLSKEGEKSSVSFGINPYGFDYSGLFLIDDDTYLSIRHYFSNDSKEENSGEIISIQYFKVNSHYKITKHFNISKWTIGDLHEPKKTPSQMAIAEIYLDLVKGTKLAADLTVNNLARNIVAK